MVSRMHALRKAGRHASQLVRAQAEQAPVSHSTARVTAGVTARMTAGADKQLLVRSSTGSSHASISSTRLLTSSCPRDQAVVHLNSLWASRARSSASLPLRSQQLGATGELPVWPARGIREVQEVQKVQEVQEVLGMTEAASLPVVWKWREGVVGHQGRIWSQLCGEQAASKASFTRQLSSSSSSGADSGGAATGPAKVVGSTSGAAATLGAPPPPPPTPPPPLPEKPARWSHVLRSILELQKVPLVPLALGLAGALPFVALVPPLAPLLPLPDLLASQALHAQVSYGHLILSFLGAPHWGLAMANYGVPPSARAAAFTTNSIRYVWSVAPCLLAWGASLFPQATQLAALIGSFWLVFGVDLVFARLKLTPPWYLALRLPLTILATGSMALSLPVAVVHPTT